MSISLKAYPLGFLIYPSNSTSQIKVKNSNKTLPKTSAEKKLEFIKVKTNLSYKELKKILALVPGKLIGLNSYQYDNGLKISWIVENTCSAIVSGGREFQELGEAFFENLDAITQKNVRLIDNQEYFYYNYSTNFKSADEIISSLQKNKVNNYYYDTDEKLCAKVNGQDVKYYKPENSDNYFLEIEQRVSIVNIGIDEDNQSFNNTDISNKIKEIRVKTNIKKDELKQLLRKAKYVYYEGNGQTPLGSGATTLSWIEEDGYYNAIFSGANENAIASDMSKLFQKINVSAERDVRKIEENTSITYTYSTNYTDKGVLYNVLAEHGAEEITETGDNISCKLYGMEMTYIKDEETMGYNLEITRVTNLDKCETVITDLNEEYGLSIQEITYNKIKERLEKENLRLSDEEVLEDNSIVLTIEV